MLITSGVEIPAKELCKAVKECYLDSNRFNRFADLLAENLERFETVSPEQFVAACEATMLDPKGHFEMPDRVQFRENITRFWVDWILLWCDPEADYSGFKEAVKADYAQMQAESPLLH